MTLDYAHIQKLPSPLTLDDVRTILRVSKRKAVWMLKNGYIKYETTGKRTRQYIIKAEDLIEYFDKVANNDVSICIPVGIFTSRGKNIRRGRRIIAPVIIHQKPPSTLKLWLETEWKNYGDLLTVSDIADITGYALKTIKRWIDRHKLKCFLIHRKRYIPIEWLIEFYCTEAYTIQNKCNKHIKLMVKFYKNKN